MTQKHGWNRYRLHAANLGCLGGLESLHNDEQHDFAIHRRQFGQRRLDSSFQLIRCDVSRIER